MSIFIFTKLFIVVYSSPSLNIRGQLILGSCAGVAPKTFVSSNHCLNISKSWPLRHGRALYTGSCLRFTMLTCLNIQIVIFTCFNIGLLSLKTFLLWVRLFPVVVVVVFCCRFNSHFDIGLQSGNPPAHLHQVWCGIKELIRIWIGPWYCWVSKKENGYLFIIVI